MVTKRDRATVEDRFAKLCYTAGWDYDPENPYSYSAPPEGDTTNCPRCEGHGTVNGQTAWGSNRDVVCPKCEGRGIVPVAGGAPMPERYYLDHHADSGGWLLGVSEKGGSIISEVFDNKRMPTKCFITMLEYARAIVERVS